MEPITRSYQTSNGHWGVVRAFSPHGWKPYLQSTYKYTSYVPAPLVQKLQWITDEIEGEWFPTRPVLLTVLQTMYQEYDLSTDGLSLDGASNWHTYNGHFSISRYINTSWAPSDKINGKWYIGTHSKPVTLELNGIPYNTLQSARAASEEYYQSMKQAQ